MARINLRPWREERNQALQKRFISNIAGSAIFAGLAIFATGMYIDMQTDKQKTRNEFLRVENANLDRQLVEIQELTRRREQLLERLNAIEDLQGSRPLIVRNFDELVRVLPDGVHYTSVSRSGSQVSINGFAEQNRDVSALMRNMQSSIWFAEANLARVSSTDGMRQFILTVGMTRPNAGSAQ
ncbi:pilus assembly protein PilN [Nitrincola tibetensis]|uniref:Pilus assembly protein PilN n=1 Tax=Nitrincola tibetensis TaxID=2219697 RepID=A0A364NJY9_9GAMM|nr:PilN domain-containing protein [Nitrincola tibetensis]RAU17351.1 pilus assembly protein PilN [Nitrincola tibetensis]